MRPSQQWQLPFDSAFLTEETQTQIDFLQIAAVVSYLSSSHHLLAYLESVVFNNCLSTSPWQKTVAGVQLPRLAVSPQRGAEDTDRRCECLLERSPLHRPFAVRKSVGRILLQQTSEKTAPLSAVQLHFNSLPCVRTPIRESRRKKGCF